MRYQTIREVAANPEYPSEKTLRAMAKRGNCPGFYRGNRFYIDTVLLRVHLVECAVRHRDVVTNEAPNRRET